MRSTRPQSPRSPNCNQLAYKQVWDSIYKITNDTTSSTLLRLCTALHRPYLDSGFDGNHWILRSRYRINHFLLDAASTNCNRFRCSHPWWQHHQQRDQLVLCVHVDQARSYISEWADVQLVQGYNGCGWYILLRRFYWETSYQPAQ
jgi:hypothetical protein